MGSVEDIQAKLLKRQEAAAKRERAMAYALTHQVVYTTFTLTDCRNCYSSNEMITELLNLLGLE